MRDLPPIFVAGTTSLVAIPIDPEETYLPSWWSWSLWPCWETSQCSEIVVHGTDSEQALRRQSCAVVAVVGVVHGEGVPTRSEVHRWLAEAEAWYTYHCMVVSEHSLPPRGLDGGEHPVLVRIVVVFHLSTLAFQYCSLFPALHLHRLHMNMHIHLQEDVWVAVAVVEVVVVVVVGLLQCNDDEEGGKVEEGGRTYNHRMDRCYPYQHTVAYLELFQDDDHDVAVDNNALAVGAVVVAVVDIGKQGVCLLEASRTYYKHAQEPRYCGHGDTKGVRGHSGGKGGATPPGVHHHSLLPVLHNTPYSYSNRVSFFSLHTHHHHKHQVL